MAPSDLHIRDNDGTWDGSWRHNLTVDGFILESWSQGFMIGALIVMAGITIANMRNRLLHHLILLELVLAMLHGTFCFMSFRGYGWYVSGTAVPLYLSWYLHNIIAWIKNKGFFSPWLNRAYIGTLMVVAPYWVVEMYANFAFNNNIAPLFQRTRPFEALCRDPWWIFTCCNLIFNIKTRYNFGLIPLIRTSPRFGMMLVSMAISIIFLIVDVLSTVVDLGGLVGINPYWKLSLVFKCFCDTIILDDFRSTLDKLRSVVFEGGHVTPGHRPRPRLISVSTPLGDTSASSVHVYSSNRQTPGQQSTSESILRGWNWFRRSPPDHAHHEPPIGSKEEIYVRHDVGIGHKSVRDPPGVL